MPDIQTEMQKILQTWENPYPQPETTETIEQPKETTVFAPTNNVSKDTFNFIRDNSGCTRNDAVRLLVLKGHKKSSVSSLLGQMLRQGHIWKDSDGLLRPNAKEYTPIKSAKTVAKREKKAKKSKTYNVITSNPSADETPDYLTETKRAIIGKPLRSKVDAILDDISLSDAHELYRNLHQYFGGLPK